jgi:tRNA threonylcarbamoyl adenosine modification protein YeaZ
MRVLAIASSQTGARIALVTDGAVTAERVFADRTGLAGALPLMAAELLHGAPPDLVAVVVGPGSFTGLRAGIALAQGIALGAKIPVVGVTVTEAIAEALPNLGSRELWVATDSRRGQVFLDRGHGPEAFALNTLPAATGRIAVAGDASVFVAAALAARGNNVMLTSARDPAPRHVALVGERRASGALPPLPAVPLYVHPAEAKLPAGGLRPAPV